VQGNGGEVKREKGRGGGTWWGPTRDSIQKGKGRCKGGVGGVVVLSRLRRARGARERQERKQKASDPLLGPRKKKSEPRARSLVRKSTRDLTTGGREKNGL